MRLISIFASAALTMVTSSAAFSTPRPATSRSAVERHLNRELDSTLRKRLGELLQKQHTWVESVEGSSRIDETKLTQR
jgi:hypothetical protein